MLTRAQHTRINTLIAEASVVLQTQAVTDEFDSMTFNLNQQAELIELAEEIAFLNTLMINPTPSDAFVEHCKERATQNAGSNRTLPAHTNTCNRLYWQIASILFPTQSPLRILEPHTTHLLDVQMRRHSSSDINTSKNVIVFEESSIPNIAWEDLPYFVASEHCLFDVRTIECFNLDWHCIFYNALSQQYPSLVNTLYQHNPALMTLKSQLDLISGENQTPFDAIQSLIKELLLGGEQITKQKEATLRASTYLNHFFYYLELLPSDLKNACLDLCGKERGNRSLAQVLDAFKHHFDGSCVETAAQDLDALCLNPNNQSILKAPVRISREDLKTLQDSFKKGQPMDAAAHTVPNTLRISPSLLKKALATIRIENTADLIGMLITLPPGLYIPFFENADIVFTPNIKYELADTIRQALFNDQQVTALLNALLHIRHKFSDIVELLEIAIKATHADFVIRILTEHSTSKQEQLALLIQSSNQQNRLTLLEEPTIAFFRSIFSHFQQSVHWDLLETKNGNLLHDFIGEHPEVVSFILSLLSKPQKRLIAQQINEFGESTLFLSIRHPVIFHSLWSLFNKEEQQDLLLEVTEEDGETLLSEAVHDPDILDFILSEYPDKEARLLAINNPADDGSTPLHNAALINCRSLQRLIDEYTDEHARISALTTPDLDERTPLHWAASVGNIESMQVIFKVFPSPKAITQTLQSFKLDVLVKSLAYPDVITHLWPYYSEKDILSLFTNKKYWGDTTPLHKVSIKHPNSFQRLLSLASPELQYQCLMITHDELTVLQALIIKNIFRLSELLGSLYINTLKTLVKQPMNGSSLTVFAWVAKAHPHLFELAVCALPNVKLRGRACQSIDNDIILSNPIIKNTIIRLVPHLSERRQRLFSYLNVVSMENTEPESKRPRF